MIQLMATAGRIVELGTRLWSASRLRLTRRARNSEAAPASCAYCGRPTLTAHVAELGWRSAAHPECAERRRRSPSTA